MKFKRVYIDGDYFLYKLAFATQKNLYHVYVDGQLAWVGSSKRDINRIFKGIDYGYELYLYAQPPYAAVQLWKHMIRKYQEMFSPDNIIVALTGDDNFRIDIATILPYKGTRAKDKPVNYQKLKQFVLKQKETVIAHGEEADDLISKALYEHESVLIITPDKDLNNSEGYHYHPDKEHLYLVTPDEADKHFYAQLLAGDTVDNIPGINRIGLPTAFKLLSECNSTQEMERVVGIHYAKQYNDPESAMIEVGRLLWMRREPEEMWLPHCLR